MTFMLDAVTAVISGNKLWWWGLCFTVGGAVFMLIGIWNEIEWWKCRSWRRTSGTVVRLVEGNESRVYIPEIKYLHEGTEHLFLSKYGDNHPPKLGDAVEIRVHPSGTKAYRSVGLHRVFLHFLPLAMGCIFVAIGLCAMRTPPQADQECGSNPVRLKTAR